MEKIPSQTPLRVNRRLNFLFGGEGLPFAFFAAMVNAYIFSGALTPKSDSPLRITF